MSDTIVEPPKTRVVKISDNVPGAVRVDRRSHWGNPFVIGKDGDRDEVCDKFTLYLADKLKTDPTWVDPLIGKDLACHCAPQRCHADALRLAAHARWFVLRRDEVLRELDK